LIFVSFHQGKEMMIQNEIIHQQTIKCKYAKQPKTVTNKGIDEINLTGIMREDSSMKDKEPK
jgi:hypothetical protein